MRYHLDTDFLVWSLSKTGSERQRLWELANADTELEMSAVAWYEFTRGPRTPQQLAVAASLVGEIVALDQSLAERAADISRGLGSPRARANDIVISASAIHCGALLLTRNRRDFDDIPGLARAS